MAGKVLKEGYAIYPSIKLQKIKTDEKTGEKKLAFAKELIFGDRIVPYVKKDGDYSRVVIKGVEYIRVSRNADGEHHRRGRGYGSRSRHRGFRPDDVLPECGFHGGLRVAGQGSGRDPAAFRQGERHPRHPHRPYHQGRHHRGSEGSGAHCRCGPPVRG